MTNEEALKDIRRMLRGLSKGNIKYGSHSMHNWQFIVTMALEKQIPKKPIRANRGTEINGQLFYSDDNQYWKCPICTDYDVPLRENQRYCHYCGQALDWSDEE